MVAAGSANAGCAHQRGGVVPTPGLLVPLQPDVAVLAPIRSPAVPGQPVVALSLVSAVADQLDDVGDSDILVVGVVVKYLCCRRSS